MSVFLHAAYAVVHAVLAVWLWRMIAASGNSKYRCAAAIVLLIAVGLVYDNGILAAGAAIGAGSLLETLSIPRFWLHALVTPMGIFAGLQMLAVGGFEWASGQTARRLVIAAVVVLIGIGVYVDATLELHVACYDGIVRYTPNVLPNMLCGPDSEPVFSGQGPPIPSILTAAWILVAGILLWRRAGIPWLALGAILMFAGAGVPIATFGLVPGNGAEVFFIAGYTMTLARLAKG